jgi:hypothetical protein
LLVARAAKHLLSIILLWLAAGLAVRLLMVAQIQVAAAAAQAGI